jgi:uncharacterized membrane protein YagU involved in acid resistance
MGRSRIRSGGTKRLAAGAAAGLVATAPMTGAMKLAQAMLPAREQHPLPPRRITLRALRKTGLRPHAHLDERGRRGLTLAAHYGYGTGAGALFGVIAPRNTRDAVAAGVGYGLLVWAASYLGLMPALGLHPPANRETPGRNAMMIAAHVVWGAALGAAVGPLRRALR